MQSVAIWRQRLIALAMISAAVCGISLARGAASYQESQTALSGITTSWSGAGQQRTLDVVSVGRYELVLDRHGIASWHDLRSDPLRQRNLVEPGRRLLDHTVDGSLIDGSLTLVAASPLRARVRWDGNAANSARYTVEYTIWAGGQLVVRTTGSPAPTSALRRAPASAVGAALQRIDGSAAGTSATSQALVLYLDAWTGEGANASVQRIEEPHFDQRDTTTRAQATGSRSATVRMVAPSEAFRQPRFEIANWSSELIQVRHNGTPLVAGQDYLAEYDRASSTLALQYLGLLVPSGPESERTFEIVPRAGPMTLSLGISGRTLDEISGLLVVDANLPSAEAPGTPTTQDVFRIPYIQSTRQLVATAATQGAPAGSGVQFVLDGAIAATVFGTSVSVPIALSGPGEHRLDGYIVDGAGQRLGTQPDDSIAQIGYGRIYVAIGDSITAGKNGYRVNADTTGVGPGPYTYPIRTAQESPGSSADGRNFYQLDNYLIGTGAQDTYYRGYQLRLNGLTASCGNAPVFILNDGLSGSLTGYVRDTNNDRYVSSQSVLARTAAYNSHIAALGAQGVLLQIGTNDAGNAISTDDWGDGLHDTIAALTAPQPGLGVWVARVPWRADSEIARQRVQSYNSRAPDVVAALSNSTNPVRLGPDFYGYFAANQGFFDQAAGGDELHPNQAGLDNMADLWAATLCAHLPPLENGPGPTPTNTPIATPDARRSANLPLVVRDSGGQDQ